jgi:hypothetical protein
MQDILSDDKIKTILKIVKDRTGKHPTVENPPK